MFFKYSLFINSSSNNLNKAVFPSAEYDANNVGDIVLLGLNLFNFKMSLIFSDTPYKKKYFKMFAFSSDIIYYYNKN